MPAISGRASVRRSTATRTSRIAALGELDARRLYLGEGCSSLFAYCTRVLHLSEHAAYGRIEAARAARRWPVVMELLTDGSLHLTAVALLGRHLTANNHRDLLAAARQRTKREVEEIIAALEPRPAVPPTVRKLPEPKPRVAAPSTSASASLPTAQSSAPGDQQHVEDSCPPRQGAPR